MTSARPWLHHAAGPLHAQRKRLRPDAVMTPTGPRHDVEIVIDGAVIVSVDTPTDAADATVVDMPGTVVVPGMIDCHHHVEQSFAKAVSFGEPAQMWKRIWIPLGAALTPDDCFAAAKWTFIEALRGGFTAVVDSAQRDAARTEAICRAAEAVGIRLMSSTGVNDRFDPNPPSAADARRTLQRHLDLCSKFTRVHPSVACGTIQSTSGPMLGVVAGFSREHGVCFQVHANEHTGEIQHGLEHFGRRPLEHLHDHGALGPTTLIAHATLVTPAELTVLGDTGSAVSYNPVASAWKGNAVAPALEMIERGITVGLGTDATRNDAFRLVDAAETAQRLAFGIPADDFSTGAGSTWFRAATAGGAAACGLGDLTGSIEPGRRADLLVLSSRALETQPSFDLEWELVRLYDRTSVLAVLVDGEPVLVDGRPKTGDPSGFLDAELARAHEVIGRSSIQRIHGPSTAVRSATA